MSVKEPKKVKFSSFMENEKEYVYQPDRTAEKSMDKFPEYSPKPEFTRIPFDENVRHRLPKIPNHLMYRFMFGYEPEAEP